MTKLTSLRAACARLKLFLLYFFAIFSFHSVSHAAEAVKPSFNFDQYTQGQPFHLNSLPTTKYGPPWADILLKPSNFLRCDGAPIALCYYSGAGPTTPCVLDGKGTAACTCYEIPKENAYYVDINAILNLDSYLETVKVCGKDGSNCAPKGTKRAPVCDQITAKKLIPGAELISTFSTYLESTMPISATNCGSSAYAGCMTAPCKRLNKTEPTTGLDLVECTCPIYTGPYQVGTAINPDQCVLGNNMVWSAAYTPPITKPTCVPDAPGANGCPLLSPKPPVLPAVPKRVSCVEVCKEYKDSAQNGIEVGYTCDATLCTTSSDAGLVKEACTGLNKSPVSGILKLEAATGFSCAASQICHCQPNAATQNKIYSLNEQQRKKGITPQCDVNGTLCGKP